MADNALTPANPTAKRRVGRPRATPAIDDALEPRQAILDAAARLFTSQGFTASSTRQIAANAGLRQASLFHYFAKKDDILAELLDLTLQPSLDFATRLAEADPPVDAGLYLLILRDVRNLCRGPGNLGSLQIQPVAQKPEFAGFWAKRAQLRDEYYRLIEAGHSERLFEADDADLTTSIVFGLVEGIGSWFSNELPQAPTEIWRDVADRALRSLLVNPNRLDDVRREAARVGRQIDADSPTDRGVQPSRSVQPQMTS